MLGSHQTSFCLQQGFDNGSLLSMVEDWFAEGFVDYEPHTCTKEFKLTDRHSFVSEYVKLPGVLTTSLREAFERLHSDRMLNNYLSEVVVLGCLNAVAGSLSDGIDFLDSSESSVELLLEEFMTQAAENGNLGSDEDEIYDALKVKLCTFCMDARKALLQIDLPVIEYIGMPYEVSLISPHGLVLWVQTNVQTVASLIFD